MLDLAHVRKAKARNALHDLALKLVVSQRFILARRADFSTLDPLAAENGLFLYRRVRSVELVDLHGALEDLLGIFDQRFDGDVGSGGNSPCSNRPALALGLSIVASAQRAAQKKLQGSRVRNAACREPP
jgi:hypothetical protein